MSGWPPVTLKSAGVAEWLGVGEWLTDWFQSLLRVAEWLTDWPQSLLRVAESLLRVAE